MRLRPAEDLGDQLAGAVAELGERRAIGEQAARLGVLLVGRDRR
jgi:hypothetical protein